MQINQLHLLHEKLTLEPFCSWCWTEWYLGLNITNPLPMTSRSHHLVMGSSRKSLKGVGILASITMALSPALSASSFMDHLQVVQEGRVWKGWVNTTATAMLLFSLLVPIMAFQMALPLRNTIQGVSNLASGVGVMTMHTSSIHEMRHLQPHLRPSGPPFTIRREPKCQQPQGWVELVVHSHTHHHP